MNTPLLSPDGAEELPPLLLTAEEAARLLAIGRTALYHLIWDGQLKPVRIGRSVRFTVAKLEQFVADRTGLRDAESGAAAAESSDELNTPS